MLKSQGRLDPALRMHLFVFRPQEYAVETLLAMLSAALTIRGRSRGV